MKLETVLLIGVLGAVVYLALRPQPQPQVIVKSGGGGGGLLEQGAKALGGLFG